MFVSLAAENRWMGNLILICTNKIRHYVSNQNSTADSHMMLRPVQLFIFWRLYTFFLKCVFCVFFKNLAKFWNIIHLITLNCIEIKDFYLQAKYEIYPLIYFEPKLSFLRVLRINISRWKSFLNFFSHFKNHFFGVLGYSATNMSFWNSGTTGIKQHYWGYSLLDHFPQPMRTF